MIRRAHLKHSMGSHLWGEGKWVEQSIPKTQSLLVCVLFLVTMLQTVVMFDSSAV